MSSKAKETISSAGRSSKPSGTASKRPASKGSSNPSSKPGSKPVSKPASKPTSKRSSKAKRGTPRKQGDYTYSKLSDMINKEVDRVNLYAVVLDSSAPYYMEKISKYLCTMKLIDPSVNPGLEKKAEKSVLNVTFFDKDAKDLPHPQKVGTIIRIHRGQTKKFGNIHQLNCDIGIKGAWALFDPVEGTQPQHYSGKTITYVNADKTRLKEIREFGKKFFRDHELTGISLADASASKKQDFDFVGLVLETKKKDGMEHMKICDGDKTVKLDIDVGKNSYVKTQDIVRVRSANWGADKKGDKLTLNEYSNILRVPKEFKSAKALMATINAPKSEEAKGKIQKYTTQIGKTTLGSKILNTHKTTKYVALKDLFSGAAAKGANKFYKLKVNVIEMGPKDPHEWLCIVDTKTKKQYILLYFLIYEN